MENCWSFHSMPFSTPKALASPAELAAAKVIKPDAWMILAGVVADAVTSTELELLDITALPIPIGFGFGIVRELTIFKLNALDMGWRWFFHGKWSKLYCVIYSFAAAMRLGMSCSISLSAISFRNTLVPPQLLQ